jgi:pimeloyl-ACP methyl ester carboxylesterase
VRLVAVNRPGYGSSGSHESGQVSVADDTVAVADVLGIEQFAVLGMSVGGIYAIACAALHPDRVTAMGLTASPGIIPEMDPPWHRDDLHPERQHAIAQLSCRSPAEVSELLRPEFEEYVAHIDPDDTDDLAVASRWMRVCIRKT